MILCEVKSNKNALIERLWSLFFCIIGCFALKPLCDATHNGWTVDVIAHIFSHMTKGGKW